MNFDLKTPCKDCPFRSDISFALRPERAREITASLLRGESFPCHKTTKFDDDGEPVLNNKKEQHCAGALIFLERQERPNQMMRIAERLGGYDMRKLDMDAPVFNSSAAMVRHLTKLQKEKRNA